MAHAFTLLSLVDHDYFRKLTHDLDPHLRPVGRSKLSRSLIPTKKEIGGEVCYQEADISKGCNNQLQPLDE